MNPAQNYTRADITRWLGRGEVLKGQYLLDDVSRLQIQPNRITALVQGSMPRPYSVWVQFFARAAASTYIQSQCSCPVGQNCKHVAATLLAALDHVAESSRVNPDVLDWLEDFHQSMSTVKRKKPAKPAKKTEFLLYLLGKKPYAHAYGIAMLKGRVGIDGNPEGEDWGNVERALLQPPKYVDDEDLVILRLLWAQRSRHDYDMPFPLAGKHGEEILVRLLASQRFFFHQPAGRQWQSGRVLHPLHGGEPRPGRLEWRIDETGMLAPRILATPAAAVTLPLDSLWYVDPAAGQVGRLETAYSGAEVALLLTMPPLAPADIPVVAGALRDLAPDLPPPATDIELRTVDTQPVPVLTLGTSPTIWMNDYRRYGRGSRPLDYVAPSFRYDEFTVEIDDLAEFIVAPDGETVRIKRQPEAESLALKALETHGLAKIPMHLFSYGRGISQRLYALESEEAWPGFMASTVPELRAAGWEVVIPTGFRHHLLEISSWEADFGEDESGWFKLDMGIVVEGQRVPLAPLLYELFHRDPRWLDAGLLKQMSGNEKVELILPNGARVGVPAERIKPLAHILIDLFDARPEGALRLSRLDAPRLAELSDMKRWQFKGAESVQRLADKLRHADGIQPAAPPAGLGLELRPYQLEGLAWLQYLREQELAGILADDMGLGKTAQALAHLLLEKEAGRLDRPALVVLPTSLIFNWKREAERFAPDLRILSLHGKDRAERFPLILEHDVVLTTYPLLWRDEEAIAAHEYHLLILDEAQTVKNAASQAAQVVRKIKARHRLCLTGTPLENHLGELWAQFDFLLPGFLGDARGFTKTWRTPVEKHGDALRRDLLARRVKPFILRRRKQDVAKELPPKTIIVRSVELEAGQRDLYETVRSAMDQRVREEIAARGFARSQIVILDALLKLRQVCCDPRLLKSEGAKKVKERAKLDLLMGMLPELVDEGRRVLLFSQFTSMLDLIIPELARHKLDYVMLTGDTQDREGVIRRFQDGEVPIFLISLKAGGVGLNLTAADTVIHYDPWWNPAVENQATDRAHRIGQTKNVFVYKLVVAGSIEEKILALQEKKAALAAGILSEDASGLAKFGEADLAALLAPLPTEVKKG